MKQNNNKKFQYEPLASRMRPRLLRDFFGQDHLLSPGKPLHAAIEQGYLHSMILWGPPGTGKTTLARLMATQTHSRFLQLSALFTGVKDIRSIADEAKDFKNNHQQATILFIDEIHRFNKAQQDVFLPYLENGTFILIGATTENPSFALNNALLSRARVYLLKPLSQEALLQVLQLVLKNNEQGLGELSINFPEDLQQILVRSADGDARQVINLLEIMADLARDQSEVLNVTPDLLTQVLQVNLRRFDKKGDYFYDQISALHKAIRGSSPDAALYWLARMLDGGCDPLYLARRIIRMSTEDIGLAEPRAMQVALNAYDIYERLGSPEGELALAEAVVYFAVLPKSNAVYKAFGKARREAKKFGTLPVPNHLRNAPTKLMKDLGHGKDYRYAHDEHEAYATLENYFPEGLTEKDFYTPTPYGLELKISERLAYLRKLDFEAKKLKS